MKKTILAEARWEEKWHRWKINVSVEGQRRSFYSSVPGRKGKKEAEEKAQLWADTRSGKDMRLDVAVGAWLDYKRLHVSSSTFRSQKGFILKWFLRPDLATRHLSRITPAIWQSVLDAAFVEGLSYSSRQALCKHIFAFLRFATRSRWPVEALLPDDLVVAPPDAPRPEKAILQPDDLRTLFTVDTILTYRTRQPCWEIHSFRLAAVLGLRRGELTALRWQDITKDTLTVHASINRYNVETPGKTKNAVRTIALNDHVRAILAAQRAQLKQHNIVSPFVFPAPSGQHEYPGQFSKVWKRYAVSNGINPDVTFHGLRHTAISLYKADVPEQLLKQVVGHSRNMDTFGQYGHAVDGDALRASELMEAALSKYI